MHFQQNLRWSGGQALIVLSGWLLLVDWMPLSMIVFLGGLFFAYHVDNALAKVLRDPIRSRMFVSKLTVVTSLFAWQAFTIQAVFWPTNWFLTSTFMSLWLIFTFWKWLLDVKRPFLHCNI